jgi:predicted Zn-dependent protease
MFAANGAARQRGDPQSVWRKLQAKERDAGADAMPQWLSTHPSTAERLREATRAPAAVELVRNPQ